MATSSRVKLRGRDLISRHEWRYQGHPTAQAVIKLLEVSAAEELGEIIVAVGLAQNQAACRALVTEGIQRGHMSLHASNIALAVGATPELPEVVARLIGDRAVRQDHPAHVIAELRATAANLDQESAD
jgi:hydroxymethylglutaryl-CoA reductase